MKTSYLHAFQDEVLGYYTDYGRHDMLWRLPEPDGSFDPYKILVSEVMLQQTQVARVTVKFPEFLTTFPNVAALAQAPLAAVLARWSGLGYNRRAKFLWQAAGQLQAKHQNMFPQTLSELVDLPGIGPNTAGAIMAYAYNQPVVFIETNIRTVFIHHFFHDETDVSDAAIRELVAASVYTPEPRLWYWALMDYGSHLKASIGNLNHASKSYAKQSAFKGSKRQIRGQVLRLLIEKPLTEAELERQITDERLPDILAELAAEQFILIIKINAKTGYKLGS